MQSLGLRHFTAVRRLNLPGFPGLAQIRQNIVNATKPVAPESARLALQACKAAQDELLSHDKFKSDPRHESIVAAITSVLTSPNVQFDPALLKNAFLMRFPPSTTTKIISAYYARHPKAVIDKALALIPLRHSLYDADLHSAVRITDMTTGHPNYVEQKNRQMRRGVWRLAGSAIGLTLFSKLGVYLLVETGWLLQQWTHMAPINAMLLTYLFNLSFFVAIVKFGRELSSAGGDFLKWQKGTFYTHWYRHADEMAFCTKIMEVDASLNNGGNSEWLAEELCRKDEYVSGGRTTLQPGVTRDGHKVRLLEPRDSLEDLKMQAYWMSGGDGFEWVEPDQDPAEILWRQHLQRLHSPVLKEAEAKSLKWADELMQ